MLKSPEQYLSGLSFVAEDKDKDHLDAGERAFVEKYLGLDALPDMPAQEPEAIPLPALAQPEIKPRLMLAERQIVVAPAPALPDRLEMKPAPVIEIAISPEQIAEQLAAEAQPGRVDIVEAIQPTEQPDQAVAVEQAQAPVEVAAKVETPVETEIVAEVEAPVETAVVTEVETAVDAEVALEVETPVDAEAALEVETSVEAKAAVEVPVETATETATETLVAIEEPVAVNAPVETPVAAETAAEDAVKVEAPSAAKIEIAAPEAAITRVAIDTPAAQAQPVRVIPAVRPEAALREKWRKAAEIQMVSFFVAGQIFLLPVEGIKEVVRHMELIKVPQAPEFVAGCINLRGHVTPVVHLSALLTNEGIKDYDERNFIIVTGTEKLRLGLIIDKVNSMHMVPQNKIIWNPESKLAEAAEFLNAIVDLDDHVCGMVAPETITRLIMPELD